MNESYFCHLRFREVVVEEVRDTQHRTWSPETRVCIPILVCGYVYKCKDVKDEAFLYLFHAFDNRDVFCDSDHCSFSFNI